MTKQKLKIKNLQHLPSWELIDIYNLLKTDLIINNETSRHITIYNHNIDDYEESTYYDLYTSNVKFNIDMSFDEFFNEIIEKENHQKEYKTLKGLLSSAIKLHKQNGKNYFEFSVIKNLN